LGEDAIEMGKWASEKTKDLVINIKDKSLLLMDAEE